MKYGLIGEKLSHSFSKELHTLIADYDYEPVEIDKENLETFFRNRDFCGVNVTIPYKQSVIKYLDFIDDAAQTIGAVNTVINRGGKLYGYNTDAFGMSALIEKSGVFLKNKKVLILGSGGTSETALFVAKKMGAKCVLRVSRTENDGFVTYKEAKTNHKDAEILINTTPVGMYPNISGTPVDLSVFTNLEAVFDAVYNPIKSRLIISAEKLGIKAAGGLYMLVMQGIKAAELFTDDKIDIKKADEIFLKILRDKRNIVLIGMPTAGKTEIGKRLSLRLNMPFFDSDSIITEKTGKTPAQIIKGEGETVFRKIESEVIRELSVNNHCIIATGGGAVTVDENITNLKANGKVYYVDRPLNLLTSSPDRPLSSSPKAILTLYENRKYLYKKAADKVINNNADIDSAAETIRKDFYYENFSY